MNALAELNRRLDNLLRLGTVAQVQGSLCRVQTGDILTNWRPWFTRRAGSARTSWRPTVGEQVMLLSPSGELGNACVLPAIYCDAFPEPDDHATRERTTYPDGAIIEYDPQTGALAATGIKTATLQASDLITLDAPRVHITGRCDIDQGGTFKGDFGHSGGAFTSNGITVHYHGHKNVQPGTGTSGGPI